MITLVMYRRNPDGTIREKVSHTGGSAEVASFWIRGGNTTRELNTMKPGQAGKIVCEQKKSM